MRSLLPTFAALLGVTGILVGCRSSGPVARTETSPVAAAESHITGSLSAEELRRASSLYTVKCARCHKFYNPADYSDAEWRAWMMKMSRKARLKPEQAQLLSRYLETFRVIPDSDANKLSQ